MKSSSNVGRKKRTGTQRLQRRAPAVALPVRALQLVGRWQAIAQGHVALASGCSCGVGMANVRVQDFEEQILEYLQGKYAADAAVAPWLAQGSVQGLLTALARSGASSSAASVLADLERTVESFERQHSGR